MASISTTSTCTEDLEGFSCTQAAPSEEPEVVDHDLTMDVEMLNEPMDLVLDEEPVVISSDATTQTKGCVGCTRLMDEIRQLGNKIITLKDKYAAAMKKPVKVSTGK